MCDYPPLKVGCVLSAAGVSCIIQYCLYNIFVYENLRDMQSHRSIFPYIARKELLIEKNICVTAALSVCFC